ncbi:hypothetical protein MBAV_001350 [Candidatus Magnetobacterium bavaricum]|uniref:Uncharacterized protein n=1 Tax=Candidatus Magnetobacterium bavaricum TaxID=29290 RepID=A0A0F3GWV8_9BACT|nr:hypothetical protein MBAV_001350 [Candidatus Magnetobacterium bavaricum]
MYVDNFTFYSVLQYNIFIVMNVRTVVRAATPILLTHGICISGGVDIIVVSPAVTSLKVVAVHLYQGRNDHTKNIFLEVSAHNKKTTLVFVHFWYHHHPQQKPYQHKPPYNPTPQPLGPDWVIHPPKHQALSIDMGVRVPPSAFHKPLILLGLAYFPTTKSRSGPRKNADLHRPTPQDHPPVPLTTSSAGYFVFNQI